MIAELFTVGEVAATLKVGPTTVRAWLNSGQLVGMKAGQGWRITEEDLAKFLRRKMAA